MSIEIVILISGIVCILVIIALPVELFDKRLSLKKWKPMVSDTKLIQETIVFTGPILREKGVRLYPTFRISNYKHKKFKAYYQDSKIVIYITNNNDIPELVETVLHEVCHHIQFRSHLYKNWRPYEYYNDKGWGRNNPYESEAREFAYEWIEPCIKHLVEKGLIVHK
jgi:Zn-dependent peptidase ImmA (M78 family)